MFDKLIGVAIYFIGFKKYIENSLCVILNTKKNSSSFRLEILKIPRESENCGCQTIQQEEISSEV